MRAAFALAAFLGITVATLMSTMSAQEFTRWIIWMQAEQQGSDWQARRHAELLAGVHNSGRVQHADQRLFELKDFLRSDPWAAAIPQRMATPEELKRQHRAWLERQEA